MFYAHFVLAKKGPLARIWLAAHWDKKLTKAHVFETNIEKSVEGILQPKVKMALRTSGHLLLGVVRIYSRKAKYLLADCNEAFVKIKMAFRPGVVDLPETNREAAVNAITLPEVFHNFDTAVPDSVQENVLDTAEFVHHQTRAEEITMREDYGSLNMDSGTGGNDAFMSDLIMTPLDTEEDPSKPSGSLFDDDDENEKNDILFNDESDVQRGGLYDDEDDDAAFDDDDNSHLRDLPADHPPSPLMSSREPTPTPSMEPEKSLSHVASPPPADPSLTEEAPPPTPQDEPQKEASLPAMDQTTLIRDEEESFALAPVDASAIRGTVRTKRKRKLIVDEVKAIAGEEMKAQLSDTADIVTTLDLAPPTKRLMHWKETGGVEKLFALPGRPLHDTAMFKFYQSQLTARPSDNEEFGLLGDSENIMLENVPGAAPPARPDSPFEPVPTPRRAPRKRKTVNEESPSKRAQREEDEAAALAQAEAYRREQQAMMNNSDMYDTNHLLQKQREEEEAAASQDPWPEDPSHQDLNTTKDSEEGLNTSEEQAKSSELPPEAPPTNAEAQPPENQFDNLGYNGATSDPNTSWDAMNGEGDLGSPGAPSMGAPTPHHDVSDDDYGGPMSVAPNPEEEMGEEETIEEFEDRVLNKRALQLSNILKNKFESKEAVVFNSICRGNVRKQAAQKFYSMLVLQKVMALEVSQPGSCGDISITKGPKFDTAVF